MHKIPVRTWWPMGSEGECKVRIVRFASIVLTVGTLTAVSAGILPVTAWSIAPNGFQVVPSMLRLKPAALRSQSICTGPRLARAAHSWAVANHGPAGSSEITSFYCRGSYALSNASTTEDGGYGFELTYRKASTSTWKVIDSANLVPPNGLPRNVYRAFLAIQPKFFHHGVFRF
jgi:hypothetical protein